MRRSSSPIAQFRYFLLRHFAGETVPFVEIRNAVKQHFPQLCNDAILCTDEYPHRPEWEHQLRHALDYLKNKAKRISQPKRGEYTFP
jgi:hypothetical protein